MFIKYGWEMLLWILITYSFLGWVLETIAGVVKQKHFVNRGIINGPFCLIYGIAAVCMALTTRELHGFWLFLGCAILATVVEWIAGHWIEHWYHERWWNYRNLKWNLDGYISLPTTILWGGLGFLAMSWGNGLLRNILGLIPGLLRQIILLVIAGIIMVDAIATLIILSGRSRRLDRWQATDAWMDSLSKRLGNVITRWVDRRIKRAYSVTKAPEREKAPEGVFAYGCGFYKLVVLFVVGAFLGDIVETIFCRFTMGQWMSRSSVVWGPFSIVWGLAIAGATAFLYRYRDRSDGFIFGIGTLLGGAYEYICSVFTEIVFGKVFWDYSHIPFNLGGRINLLYCFFWGIAGVVWLKLLYPHISGWIEKLPVKFGKCLTWVLLVFMVVNMAVSGLALMRYDERGKGNPAENAVEEWLDVNFDDARMQEVYSNAKQR